MDGKGRTLWSCNASVVSRNSTATIFDTGNLVLSEMSEEGNVNKNHLWQSFDDPSDSFISRMEISVNLRTKEKKVVTSWRSEDDPAPGNYMFGLEAEVIPQLFIWNGSIPYWRSGQWNGRTFIGMPYMYDVYINGPTLVEKDGIVYYAHSYSTDEYSRLWLDWKGRFRQENWDEGRKEWNSTWMQLHTQCDIYGTCGPFGICKETKSPVCSCLRGFKPKFPEEWSKGNWSGGCVRTVQLNCERNTSNGAYDGGRDGFLKLGSIKMPDFAGRVRDIDANACEAKCVNNCSCVAYTHVSGIGCMIWSGDLIDLRDFDSSGEDLHIRVSSSELGKKKNLKAIIIGTLVIGVFILSCCTCIFFRRIARKGALRNQKKETDISLFDTTLLSSPSSDLNVLRHGVMKSEGRELLFDFDLIAVATNNFSAKNKIGEGGFGPVYKGKLPEGQEIAVKRLSKSSGQGVEQFKNEVVLISKLQHRNLVRLLGCCIQGEEKLLVYEYMPNKSLDAFIFDPSQGATLEWKKRFHIVEEIARGILYLHRDSRLRIIHRDLKAGNILLDRQMNPKISDFGMARIFGGDQIIARTNRVVGTYGYMSPEYAMEGRFSEKSDVFSFGVLLLEIVSGKRSTGFHHPECSLGLLGYVWRLWNDGNISAIIDPILGDLSSTKEVLRCIQVGLLCVQEFATDRPVMSSVVFMLSSDIAALPTPKQPAFAERTPTKTECSINEVSITIFQGR